MKVFWVPLTPDEARGVLTKLQIAYQPTNGGTCSSVDVDSMQVMTIMEEVDTQSVALIDGLEGSKEYCVGIQVSTTAGESGYSNTLKAHCKPRYIAEHKNDNFLVLVPSDVFVQLRLKVPEDEYCAAYIVSEGYVHIHMINGYVTQLEVTDFIHTISCDVKHSAKYVVNHLYFAG